MKNKLLPITIIFIIIACVVACISFFNIRPQDIDTVKLNDLKNQVENSKGDYSKIDGHGFNVVIINSSGNVLYSSNTIDVKSYDEWINYAYKSKAVIMDYTNGKILIFEKSTNFNGTAITIVIVLSLSLIALLIGYWFYLKKVIFNPFERLQMFANNVSVGDFDSPLFMDKGNAFGAFSESFDIMRTELKRSKEKEIELEKSKKQLVAELSHDIKTPIASIKAVAELLAITEANPKKKNNINIIYQKATEIDNLVTDMFNVTLQELSELKINITKIYSSQVECIIKEADYLSKLKNFTIPDCMVEADKIRLAQIVGNILNNSYKYAQTHIEITSFLTEKRLAIEFRDFGSGVLDEDLPLITNKYYKGKNSDGKGGAGLGLYICKEILEKLGGGFDCYNTENGFAVKIYLTLA